MTEIKFEPISANNFQQCINLRVNDSQTNFVASNLYSIAESKIYDYLKPLAIRAGGNLVGFTMHGREPQTGKHFILRLMIDAAHQGKGFGRAAVKELIDEMCREYDCEEIFLSFVPGNAGAEALYRSIGFERTGETDSWGEIVMRLKMK
jgi:diamine N-acetyltransferase